MNGYPETSAQNPRPSSMSGGSRDIPLCNADEFALGTIRHAVSMRCGGGCSLQRRISCENLADVSVPSDSCPVQAKPVRFK